MTKLILIIVIQLIYVPMLTLRTITMVKNLKILTAFFGALEAFVYVFGLAIVLSGEQNTLEMVVYAIGFALGLFLGIFVEQKLAIGFTVVQVNINHQNQQMVNGLRALGFGVTVITGQGMHDERIILDILTKRRREKELYTAIAEFEPNAFVVSYEPKTFKGGYLTELMKKSRTAKSSVLDDNEPIVKKSLKEISREFHELIKGTDMKK